MEAEIMRHDPPWGTQRQGARYEGSAFDHDGSALMASSPDHPFGWDPRDTERTSYRTGQLGRPVLSPPLNRLLVQLGGCVSGIEHALIVTMDSGRPLAVTEGTTNQDVDRLAAISRSLVKLTLSVSRFFAGGPPMHCRCETRVQTLLVTPIPGGSALLAVLAAATCDLRALEHHMMLLVDHAGQVLHSPSRRRRLA